MPFVKPLMIPALAATCLLTTAGAALAQTAPAPGQAAGLRYLSWNGRTAVSAPAARPAASEAAPVATPARADLRRPNRVIPHGGFARAVPAERPGLTPAPNATPGALTPAEVWTAPRATSPAAPVAPPESAYTPPPPTRVEPPRELAPTVAPDYLPSRGVRQPVPAELVMPQPLPATPVYEDGTPTAVPSEPAADPMAPRRDAPIFRLQRPAASPAPQAEPAPPAPRDAPGADAPRAEAAPTRRTAVVTANTTDRPSRSQGARYYSVHRQNGQAPDAVALPDPTYVDALAVTLAETPASQDLAQPDRGPTLIRDNQGRLRAAPAASDGDYQ